ncbi:hypothetical protein BpHYR1_053143 [Brachionus plicatilis]|uniref:Uncharacterized protein n=1 Tax=Brachionus plicatilis TaxID=10195 RepID=A0A3M7QVD1_BRAPC|nr:hypothetical protein BpHYR1_053143 [Brachionus plicatilis]
MKSLSCKNSLWSSFFRFFAMSRHACFSIITGPDLPNGDSRPNSRMILFELYLDAARNMSSKIFSKQSKKSEKSIVYTFENNSNFKKVQKSFYFLVLFPAIYCLSVKRDSKGFNSMKKQ